MATFTRKLPRLLVAVLALTAVLFIACSGDDDGSDPTSTATTEVESTATPDAEATATPDDDSAATPTTDGGARVATEGDAVAVHYRGTLDNGEEFDSSRGGAPLSFVVGSGQLIAGFDAAVRGLAVGDTVTVKIPPAEAYGEVDPARVIEFPIDQAPEGLKVGDQVSVSGAPATVTAISDEMVTVDANHQLAGETLTFEIELVSIE